MVLGSIARFASAAADSQIPTTEESGRDRAYRLLRYARKLLPDERVAQCQRAISPGADSVLLHYAPGRARYENLVRCDSPWMCPHCARRHGEQARKELDYALRTAIKSGLVPILVTLTLRHQRSDSLHSVLDACKGGLRALKSGRAWQRLKCAYGLVGSVKSLETTYGDNGWHCHVHMIIFCEWRAFSLADPNLNYNRGSFSGSGAALGLRLDIFRIWNEALKKHGFDASWEHGVDVQVSDKQVGSYIAKWGIEHELTKSQIKQAGHNGRTMFQLLDDFSKGDDLAGRLFREYALVFKGSHQLDWSSKEFKDQLLAGYEESLELDPAAASVDQSDQVENGQIIKLSPEQWKLVTAGDFQGQLLKVASTGDAERIYEFLRSLGVPKVIWGKLDLRNFW